ncbi:centrosomal protein of 120 kDa-like [Sinocyclocheilus anshuiensis]|uniref:centrosomal protein of 120 kDa-like n=1 Tax=Sinocyclocheilus anshuiensis TaxID=1608454 RepID=UPI0007BAD374|nr:PREDICTED: centrosomal protein of 120 kDa-like [Sinocyclocheilus anshuiensis]
MTLQRTPIKLQCYAVDSGTSARECVEYIVLDLRSVQEIKQAPKWHSLLSSKYTKLKPALLISVILENDTKPTAEQFKAKKAPLRPGFHQIGPEDVCTNMFVLSVTVAFATKLEQLISSSNKLSSEGAEFFFYYTLLGNDVTSEPFQNLLSPNFEPERASVCIRSSERVLQLFLAQQPFLQIHLCCGNRFLGSTDVGLAGLIKSSADLTKHPSTIEVTFNLQPPNRVKPSLQSVPPDLQPTVDIPIENGPKTPVKKGPVPAARHECPRALMTPSPARSPDRPLRSPAASPEHQHSESKAESLCSDDRQAPPTVHERQAPPIMYERQAPPTVHERQTPPTTYERQAPPTVHEKQAPPTTVPLAVEMWHREPSSGDVLLGSVSIHLSRLLSAEKTRFLDPSGHQHWRHSCSERIPIMKADGPEKLAELCYVSALEDLGFVKAQDVLVSESSQGPNEAETVTRPRETLEYKAALELEMWKEMQEDLFDNQLKQKERSHMQALAEEWRNRDHQREIIKKKEMEYSLLEEQLQKTLSDLEKSEKALAHAEMQTQWLRSEHEFSMRELQDSGRRLREDCAHQVELERSKFRQLEDLLAQQRQQIQEAENKCKQLEKEFELYRDQQNVRPEVRLQSEINLLTLEKVRDTKSYTEQRRIILKELARFKRAAGSRRTSSRLMEQFTALKQTWICVWGFWVNFLSDAVQVSGESLQKTALELCLASGSFSGDSPSGLSKEIASALSAVPGFEMDPFSTDDPLVLEALGMLSDGDLMLADPAVEDSFRSDQLKRSKQHDPLPVTDQSQPRASTKRCSGDSPSGLSKEIASALSAVPGFEMDPFSTDDPLVLEALGMLSDGDLMLADPAVEDSFRSDQLKRSKQHDPLPVTDQSQPRASTKRCSGASVPACTAPHQVNAEPTQA